MNYIKAVVQYDEYLNIPDPDDPTKYKKNDVLESTPMTLWDAKRHGWGNPVGVISGQIYNQTYSYNEPLSYSTMFYYNANKCKGGTGCISTSKEEDYVDDLFAQIVMQFLYQSEGSNKILSQLNDISAVAVSTERGCTTGDSVCKVKFIHD